MNRLFRASLSRIATLDQFEVKPLPRDRWEFGDYVVGLVARPPAAGAFIELTTGRHAVVDTGDRVLGAFGTRYATLEVTGSWEQIGEDGVMSAMTAAGLFGRISSKSPFLADPTELEYAGHVIVDGDKAVMRDFVPAAPAVAFSTPVLLIVGSSMSAGKTNSARIITRRLKAMGLRVVAMKLTGAGRYRDILSMADAGADHVFDFVDAGLPSTVCPEPIFRAATEQLLARVAAVAADVAVVEAGASPLEPYNGKAATDMLQANLRMMLLCASDPYSVVGMIKAFGRQPDLVAGIACNTDAGIELIGRLTGIPALCLIEPNSYPELDRMLRDRFIPAS